MSDFFLRVVCDAPSHSRPVVIATYHRVDCGDFGDFGDDASWTWSEELAVGGGTVDIYDGVRHAPDTRPATQEERDEGYPSRIELDPKRGVRSPEYGRDDLECAKCGLRLRIGRAQLEHMLEGLYQAGASRVGLPAIVATLT